MLRLLILMNILLLGSCSLYQNPTPTKVSGIKENIMINKVNDMTRDGRIDIQTGPYLGDGDLGGNSKDGSTEDSNISKDNYEIIEKASGYQVSTPNIGQPIRAAESIQKIYIFPYRDKDDNYYEASIMYVVLEKSHWIDYPVQSIQEGGLYV